MSTKKVATPGSKSKSRSRSKPQTRSKSKALSKLKSLSKKKSATSTKAIMENMKSESKVSLKVCEAYDSNDADVELISSDNVIFKVHSYRLQSASPVFRDMIALANSTTQRDPIHLTHATVEHSVVIHKALDIIYTSDFDVGLVEKEFNLVKFLIDFGKKWEIGMIRHTIHKELSRHRGTHNGSYMEHFLIALHLEDNKLAVKYFDDSDEYDEEWQKEQVNQTPNGKRAFNERLGQDRGRNQLSEPLGHHYLNDTGATGLPADHLLTALQGGELFHPGIMPYDVYLQIPPTVHWIIARAQYIHQVHGQSTIVSMKILLDLAYPPPKPVQVE